MTWFAKNLRVQRYNDGSDIPRISSESDWSDLKIGAIFIDSVKYNKYVDIYGTLYNHYAVTDPRGLCPQGFRVPSANDWKQLTECLGGDKLAGSVMKDVNSQLWMFNTSISNNSSGFSALPAGGKGRYGSIGEIGYYATWWANTSEDSIYAWHWGLFPDKNDIRYNPGHKNSGFSVRCILCD